MISLEELLASRPGQEPLLPFPALTGEVTALMVRTAVVVCGDERALVRLDCLMVDPDALQWRADTGIRRTENGQPDPHNGARLRGRVAQQVLRNGKEINRSFVGAATAPLNDHDREWVRARSDERAIADQATKSARPRVAVVKPRKVKPAREPRRFSWKAQKALKELGLRHCPRCGNDKPLADFYANGYCTTCGKEYNVSLYQGGFTAKSQRQKRRTVAA